MKSAVGKAMYVYDGLGRRVSVVANDGVNHIQVYSQEGKLMYMAVAGHPLETGHKYVYLHNHMIAEVGAHGGVDYMHADGLGSPVAVTNGAGSVVIRTRYEPYGATAAGTTGPIGFGGHVIAGDLGLVYMQQRYYDPVAGRFLSIDPITTDANTGGSFNRYAYAANNPYKYIDPDGRSSLSVEAFRGFGRAVTVGYANGELAVTVNAGAGLGGGVRIDPRSGENGRMSPTTSASTPALAGITVAGYAKVGAEIKTPLGAVSAGGKVGGERDLVTGQNVGGKSPEVGISPTSEKIRISASAQGGIEVSVYVRPGDVAAKIGEKIMGDLKPIADEIKNSRLAPNIK